MKRRLALPFAGLVIAFILSTRSTVAPQHLIAPPFRIDGIFLPSIAPAASAHGSMPQAQSDLRASDHAPIHRRTNGKSSGPSRSSSHANSLSTEEAGREKHEVQSLEIGFHFKDLTRITSMSLRIPQRATVLVASNGYRTALYSMTPAMSHDKSSGVESELSLFQGFARSHGAWDSHCPLRYFEPADSLLETPAERHAYAKRRRVVRELFKQNSEGLGYEAQYNANPARILLGAFRGGLQERVWARVDERKE